MLDSGETQAKFNKVVRHLEAQVDNVPTSMAAELGVELHIAKVASRRYLEISGYGSNGWRDPESKTNHMEELLALQLFSQASANVRRLVSDAETTAPTMKQAAPEMQLV